MLTVAIGDIHGCYEELWFLLYDLKKHLGSDNYKFVFLGDYIDRGPRSKDVLDYLIRMEKLGNSIFLRGNHDDMAISRSPNYLAGDHGFDNWMTNGGDKTLLSYPDREMSNEHKNFIFDKTVYWCQDGLRTFIHAGLLRSQPNQLSDQNYLMLTWVRNEFLLDKSTEYGYIVHGHTPGFQVDMQPNRINLDTGCAYGYKYGVLGGTLSAAVFNDEKPEPIFLLNSNGVRQDV